MAQEMTNDSSLLLNDRRFDWRRLVKKHVPITSWLPQYSTGKFFQDVLAGFTVGLTEIPQGISYGIIAGLEPQYGLYAGFMGCIMYSLFGSCKDINIGPTAIMALMVQPHVEKMGPDMAILMSFIGGCIILLLGVLHLGFVVEFFSYPVIAGFTSAAALQIGASQIKSLLGLPGKANGFLESLIKVFENITSIQLWDSVLGILSIVALILMREMKRYGSRTTRPEWSKWRNFGAKVMWLLSLSRNALIVLFGTGMALIFESYGMRPFTLTGKVTPGFPEPELPPFSTEFKNVTYTFDDMATQYGSSFAFIPLIAILETIAIAKAFSHGKTLDATQELIALGICNIAGSFFRSMPITGSFTRTAINNASGVKTTLGGLVTAIMVILALVLLASTFYYIPKPTLAAVIICAMIYLFEYEAFPVLWRTKKLDLIPFLVTLIASLLIGLEYGILIGIGSNLIFVLYSSARPAVSIECRKIGQVEAYVVTPTQSLDFPAAEYLREKTIKECDVERTMVVLDGKNIGRIDATVAKNFKVLVDDLISRGQTVRFTNFKPSVVEVCVGVDKALGQYFRNESLEDLVNELLPERITVHMDHTIQ